MNTQYIINNQHVMYAEFPDWRKGEDTFKKAQKKKKK